MNLADRIIQAVHACKLCAQKSPAQREKHINDVMRQVLAVQSRPPRTLPATAWPLGRPPREETAHG